MASINKLSVRGIRAFSPEDNEQVIEFFFPLTVIIGANGCGKTTLIEALKFAVCGSYPVGGTGKSGAHFVHDPKVIGLDTVKAQVKLRFTNKAGHSMVVIRSMEVAQKRAKATFKQLDGVIRMTDEHGQRQALSHKCSELDQTLPFLLGVSKAILENVVFCHQEEASWPLQDAAVLKKRFDDIFDSTRYSKALKEFEAKKKEYVSMAKDLKADVERFASHKHAAQGFKQEIRQLTEQMEQVEDDIQVTKKKAEAIQEERTRLMAILEKVYEINRDITTRVNEIGNLNAVMDKQRQMLQEDLTSTHTVRELKEMLRDFDSKLSRQSEEKGELEDEIRHREAELDELRKKQSSLNEQLGRIKTEKDQQEKRLVERYERMIEIGRKYGLDEVLTHATQSQLSQATHFASMSASPLDSSILPGEPLLDIPQTDLEMFFEALEKKEKDLAQEVVSQKALYRQQEDDLQATLTDVQAKLKSIEKERDKLDATNTEIRQELQKITQQIPGASSRLRKGEVEEAQQKAEEAAKERDRANSDPRRSEIPIAIRSNEEKMNKVKLEIRDDKEVLAFLKEFSDAQNSIGILKDQCSKELDELLEFVQEQAYNLQKFGVPRPSINKESLKKDNELTLALDGVRDRVADKLSEKDMDVTRCTDEVNQAKRAISEKSALLVHEKSRVDAIKSRLVELQQGSISRLEKLARDLKRFETQNGINTPNVDESKPQELLAYIESRLEEVSSDSMDDIQPEVVRKIFKKLKRFTQEVDDDDDIRCPCCTRTLDTQQDITAFAKQMKLLGSLESPLLASDPTNHSALQSYSEWKTTASKCLNDALEYKRLINEEQQIQEKLATLETSSLERSKQLDGWNAKLEDAENEQKQLRDLLDVSKRWSESASRIAEKQVQVKSKLQDLAMGNTDVGGRDIRQVEADIETRREQQDNIQAEITRLNKELSNLNARIGQLTTTASRLEQLARAKEKKYHDDNQMAKRKTELNEKIHEIVEESKKLSEQIAPLTEKHRKKEKERERLRKLAEEEEQKLASVHRMFVSDFNELKSVAAAVDQFSMSGKDHQLNEVSEKLEASKQQVAEEQGKIEKLKPSLERLIRSLNDQESHRRNLNENINLIESQSRIEEVKKDVARLQEEAASIEGQDTAGKDNEKLERHAQKLSNDAARLQGERNVILEQIRSLKRKLKSPEYKDVEEQHRVALIKQETTLAASRDADKYYKALDKALLRFHGIKISEINNIIRELWRLTYKGEDITSIEIVSGQEAGSKAAKSYNYRVVMYKGSERMDMRGRCSAGQRVLASIVIRLALAETFCVNCGCIALDEPTVNLDYHNKQGLAVALAQIIASRSSQENFQLILITHDEDFVGMMKNQLSVLTGFSMPERYFQVRREEGTDGKFYSKINAVDWDELV